MTSAQFFFCVTCLFIGKMDSVSAHEINLKPSSSDRNERRFISAHVGDNVTLRCFCDSDSPWFFWYMQPLGEKPMLLSSFYVFGKKVTLKGKFEKNPRFSLNTENRNHHLIISDLKLSDSATYYCATSYAVDLDFAEGTVVIVKDKDLNIQALINQSSSETIQPGDSVMLKCTVQTWSCNGEHRVYWFKESEESHAGLIYTHGGRNDQCERNPDSEIHTCMYQLPMKDLNVSHAGTYYCAVASCGHILFGNRTRLDFSSSSVLVYFLTGTLAVTTILVILLISLVCKMSKRNQCTEERFPAPPTASTGVGLFLLKLQVTFVYIVSIVSLFSGSLL
ncbi:uncharacterized protein LOC133420160 isoform X2 [Cololabis saira]|uniref:uncharacterized protein LOC133420160 isoform X2 n=1 Tax=Cololabis saira TaxID=129043 RepID=UPI002AD35800|nr:uncharacterized protein LOC133420160 isoform X2 [Cololabis saira]